MVIILAILRAGLRIEEIVACDELKDLYSHVRFSAT